MKKSVEYLGHQVDALSRLPLLMKGPEYPSEVHLCNVKQIESLPVTSHRI